LKKDKINIAIACELAPAKAIIPIIKKLKLLEEEGELNWKKSKIIALTHGKGTEKLVKDYCEELYPIGEGRASGQKKRNTFQLAYLIIKDIFKAINALKNKNIDLLISCGNAGDVRKSIIAAKLLKIPILHIEQDIYNPIEVIAYANIITVPNKNYKDFLIEKYYISEKSSSEKSNSKKNNPEKSNSETNIPNKNIDKIKVIHGYPMASYVNDFVANENLQTKEEIITKYGFGEFILLFLGGDIRSEDLKNTILAIKRLDFPTLIAPYRFKKELIEKIVNSDNETDTSKIKVVDEFVDILSLMKIAKLLIYGAGMGMTIEAGVLEVPSIKIAGFHEEHSSVDLAKELSIPILKIEEIEEFLANGNEIAKPNGDMLIKNSSIAIDKVLEIINYLDFNNLPKKSGFKVMKAIWKERSKYR